MRHEIQERRDLAKRLRIYSAETAVAALQSRNLWIAKPQLKPKPRKTKAKLSTSRRMLGSQNQVFKLHEVSELKSPV